MKSQKYGVTIYQNFKVAAIENVLSQTGRNQH